MLGIKLVDVDTSNQIYFKEKGDNECQLML